MKAPFKQQKPGKQRAMKDERGSVRIRVMLLDERSAIKKGNLSLSLRVAGATVSEVHAAIERLLFGGKS